VLILDEPTSALDAGSESHLLDSLERLRRGRTTIIIAHRLSTIRHADLIVILELGGIIKAGTHDQLMAQGGRYARMHETQGPLKGPTQ
jgi:ABC-type multidrug transport system fused ATPase/permease subunit